MEDSKHIGILTAGGDSPGLNAAIRGENTVPVPLDEVAGNLKTVPLDHHWISSERRVGASLGD